MYSKNFVLNNTILYFYYLDILMPSQKNWIFLFYDFSMICYSFSKIQQKFIKKKKYKTMSL